jgi:thiol-disulfide isomerase/thioredoxin
MFLCAPLQIVMKFSAIWCVPCRNAAPLFAELSLKHAGLVFVSIDVDELPVTSVLTNLPNVFFSATDPSIYYVSPRNWLRNSTYAQPQRSSS